MTRTFSKFLVLLCVVLFTISTPQVSAWGGYVGTFLANRELTGRMSRAWGYSLVNPFLQLFGAQPWSDDTLIPTTTTTTTDKPLSAASYNFYNKFVNNNNDDNYQPPETRLDTAVVETFPPETTSTTATTTTTTTPEPVVTTTFKRNSDELTIEIGCEPYKYDTPLECPKSAGYFQIGSSCYFVSSAAAETRDRKYTLSEAREQCVQLNDVSGQSKGQWHLLTITDDSEETYVAPLLNMFARGPDNQGELLWVSQMTAVPTAEDAIALGSPFVYTTNCAGPVTIAKVTAYDDRNNASQQDALAQLLASPVGCNILTTRNDDALVDIKPTCEDTPLAFVCEVEIDGDRSHFIDSWSGQRPQERKISDDNINLPELSQRTVESQKKLGRVMINPNGKAFISRPQQQHKAEKSNKKKPFINKFSKSARKRHQESSKKANRTRNDDDNATRHAAKSVDRHIKSSHQKQQRLVTNYILMNSHSSWFLMCHPQAKNKKFGYYY